MYKKTKYLIYASIILFAVFLLVLLSKQADQKIERENELIRQRNAQHESLVVSEDEVRVEEQNNTTDAQNDAIIENNIDIGQPPVNEIQTNTEPVKQERNIRSYIIHSSKFDSFDTSEKDFGLITKVFDGKYYAIAQNPKSDNNVILLYFFSKDGKLNWQGEIYNNNGKGLKPTSISANGNSFIIGFNQNGSNIAQNKTFTIKETNNSLNVSENERNYWGYTIINPSGSPASDCILVFDFTIDGSRFFVLAYYDKNNTPSYAKYVNTKFYLYKEQNGVLVYHSLLFQKTMPKDDMNILESVDMRDNGSSITIGMDNGSQRAQKTILKSQLTGRYAKFDPSHSLYIKPVNSVRTTNYDIEISPVYD